MVEIIDFHIQIWKKEFVSKGFLDYLKKFAILANIEEFPNIDYTPEKYLNDMEQEKEKDIEKYKISTAVIFPVDYSFTKAQAHYGTDSDAQKCLRVILYPSYNR